MQKYRSTPETDLNKYKLDDTTFSNFYHLIHHLYTEPSVYNFNKELYNKGKENENKKEGEDMSNTNWQEKYFDSLDENIKEIKQGFTNTENRISEMVNKHIDYSTHLDKQRHEENLRLNKKIDDSVHAITSQLDSTNKWIIGLVITTIIGIVGIVIAALSAIL